MSLDSLQDLYVESIQDLYSAEQQIIQALPKMIDKASNARLRAGFTKHLEQTREHARRLETISKRAGTPVTGRKCKGMEGLIKEGAETLKEDGDDTIIDSALIAAAQRVEHYEMAGYGCARAFAEALGLDDDAATLQETLDEEGETNETLTQIAESIITPGGQDVERDINVRREPGSTRRRAPGSTDRPDDEARA